MYKMIAIDVDDTLLTDHHTVTPGTREALAEAVAQGVVVTLATGRMFASAQAIARHIGLNVPIITYQGSLVKNLLDEQVLYERFVPPEAVRLTFEFCAERSLHLQIYMDDKLFAQEENDKLRAYAEVSKIPYTVEPNRDALLRRPVTKLLIIDDPAVLDTITAELRVLLGDQVHLTKSKPHYLEILHPEGTKGHALTFLAHHFGMAPEQVIGIGDSWNDHELLEAAGLGVAMGNAVAPLKAIADYITLTNNEEGVKHVIEKFILNHP